MMSFSHNFYLILSSLAPYRKQVTLSLFFILLHTIFGFSLIFLTSRFRLDTLPIFLILLFSVHHLFSVFDDWILTGISQRWMQDTRRKCLRSFLEFSAKSKNNSLVDWNEMQMEIHWLGDSIFSLLRSTFRKVFQIAVFSVALIWLSPILFLFCGVLFIFVFVLGFAFGRYINRLQEKVITEQSSCSNFEFEAARAMPLVRAFQKSSLFSKIHQRFLQSFTDSNIQLSRMRMIFHPIQIILFLITIVLVYSAGSALVREQNLSQNAFFSFLAGLSLLHAPLSGLSQDISLFLSSRHMKYLSTILGNHPPSSEILPYQLRSIELKSVNFSYPETETILLKDISCKFTPGNITGIHGSNGSGKTTLALLLCGVLKPDSGHILFDNAAGSPVPVSYIDQIGTVLTLNLSENLFCEEYSSSETLSDSSVFLQFLSNQQTDRHLSPETLSAGQRKCVSIERAFRSAHQILLIDEPENALDESAQDVFRQQLLQKKAQNSIIILFSHSDAFLSICDQKFDISDLSGKGAAGSCFT